MDKFLNNKRGIGECDPKSDQNLSVKSCTSKKVKPGPTRKYDDSYPSFGFSWFGNYDKHLPLCLICGLTMSNESMIPSKLGKHLKTQHSRLKDKTTSYFKRLSEQQAKSANLFKRLITVSD